MYIFTFFSLCVFAFKDTFLSGKKYNVFFIAIIILWFIFHDGFRWGIATDWAVYYNYFSNCLNGSTEDFELGYVLLNQGVRTLTDNYSFFLVLHSIIVYLLISRSISKYAVNPLFSFFFFYCMMLTYLGMNREYIAFAICMFSYKFIFDRKIIAFLLCMVIAFYFHASSLMFIIAYFLNREFSPKYLFWILFLATAISISGVLNRLPLNLFFLLNNSIGNKLSNYSESNFLTANILLSLFALVKRCVWIFLALKYKNGIKNKDQYFNFFFNMYFVGTIVYVVFNGTVLQIIVARGLLYFNIAEIFLIPYLLTIFRKGFSKLTMFILVSIYGFMLIEKGINFYKEDLGIDIYRPYNSVLMDDTYNAMDK